MKNYEVRFFNPNCPSEPGTLIVKAKNGLSAVFASHQCVNQDYGVRYGYTDFLFKETKEQTWLTAAQNWSTDIYKIVASPVAGYKQVVRKEVRK